MIIYFKSRCSEADQFVIWKTLKTKKTDVFRCNVHEYVIGGGKL